MQLELRALYRGVFRGVKELRKSLKYYIAVHTDKLAKPFRWAKSAESMLGSGDLAKRSALLSQLAD